MSCTQKYLTPYQI